VQVLASDAAFVNEPGLHVEQTDAPALEYVPGVAHTEQSELVVDPVDARNRPALHATHCVAPVVAANRPAEHNGHANMPVTLLKRPKSHAVHTALEVAPKAVAKRPVPQWVQTVA
jgi:hypothetical protein